MSPRFLVSPWRSSYAFSAYLSISDIATTSCSMPACFRAWRWAPTPANNSITFIIPESLLFRRDRLEKHRLSGAEYNRALNATPVFSVATTLFLDCNPCSDYVRLMNKGKSGFQIRDIGKALDGQIG